MNCEILDNLLLDLLYDELDGNEKIEAQTHLEGCEGCQQKFAAMGGVRRAFQAMPEPELPAFGHQALLAEAEAAAKRHSVVQAPPKKNQEREGLWAKLSAGMRLLLSPPVAVAAGVILLLGVTLSINNESQTAPMAQEAKPATAELSMAPKTETLAVAPLPTAPRKNIEAPAKPTPQEESSGGEGESRPEQKPDAQEAPRGKIAGQSAAKPPVVAPSQDGDFDDSVGSFGDGAVAMPGAASAALFVTQTNALANEGKCSDAEKTARAISAGTESWCQGMQASAKCFEQSQEGEQTRALYNEMRSFEACVEEANKALAAFDKSQIGGNGKATQSTIRSDYKKKSKPAPAPKAAEKDSLSEPFQKKNNNTSF